MGIDDYSIKQKVQSIFTTYTNYPQPSFSKATNSTKILDVDSDSFDLGGDIADPDYLF